MTKHPKTPSSLLTSIVIASCYLSVWIAIQFAMDSGSLEKPRKFGVFTRTL